MDKQLQQIKEFMNRLLSDERARSEGHQSAAFSIIEVASGAKDLAALKEAVRVLEDHAMDDMDTPYMVCFGEREFYHSVGQFLDKL